MSLKPLVIIYLATFRAGPAELTYEHYRKLFLCIFISLGILRSLIQREKGNKVGEIPQGPTTDLITP